MWTNGRKAAMAKQAGRLAPGAPRMGAAGQERPEATPRRLAGRAGADSASIAALPAGAGRSGRPDAPLRRALATLSRLAVAVADEWLPMRCVLCLRTGAPASPAAGAALCGDCDAALPGRGLLRCLRCALPVEAHTAASSPMRFCTACGSTGRGQSPGATDTTGLVLHPALQAGFDPALAEALDAAAAAADYGPPLDRLILGMKRSRPAIAAPLGALAADAAARAFGLSAAPAAACRATSPRAAASTRADGNAVHAWLDAIAPDVLAPMPLSAGRLAERGFNQSLALARPVARRLGLPLAVHALRRTRDTVPQKSLSAEGRAANLAGVFRGCPSVAGRHVMLIDDVMTTGATLREAARALKEAGAASVVGLVVARVR